MEDNEALKEAAPKQRASTALTASALFGEPKALPKTPEPKTAEAKAVPKTPEPKAAEPKAVPKTPAPKTAEPKRKEKEHFMVEKEANQVEPLQGPWEHSDPALGNFVVEGKSMP